MAISDSTNQTLVVVIAPYGPTFAEVIQSWKEDPSIQVIECSNSVEATAIAKGLPRGLLLFHGAVLPDVVKYISMLKHLQETTRMDHIRSVITTSVDQITAISKLTFYGCSEIIPEPVQARALLFKLSRHLKAIAPQVKQAGKSSEQQSTASKGSTSFDTFESPMFRYGAPLNIDPDFWILTEESPKMIAGKWCVKLLGPSQAVGRWSADEASPDLWVWAPTDSEKYPLNEYNGQWKFKGDKPQFKSGIWWFTGPEVELFYCCRDEKNILSKVSPKISPKISSKISKDNFDILVITKNSDHAKEILKFLEDSRLNRFGSSDDSKSAFRDFRSQLGDATAQQDNGVEPKIREVDPLTLASDCWAMLDRPPKWLNDHWMFKFNGPLPTLGKWVGFKMDGSNEKYWRWTPSNPEKDLFIKDPGAWEFRGFQPKFEKGLWVLVSRSPQLAFIHENKITAVKIRTVQGDDIEIAKDSATSIAASTQTAYSTDDLIFIDIGQFGTPPGKWRQVEETPEGEKTFVYIQFELLNQLSATLKMDELAAYWVFHGKNEPRLDLDTKNNWIFRERKPESFEKFVALSEEIQSFLRYNYSGGGEAKRGSQEVVDEKHSRPSSAKILSLNYAVARLSPLAFSILIAELFTKREGDIREISQCFCHIVSGSLEGMRTELWSFQSGQSGQSDKWRCIGTADGSGGKFEAVLSKIEPFPQAIDGLLVCPILDFQGDDEKMIGALVIGGENVEKISIDSIQGYSILSKGILNSV